MPQLKFVVSRFKNRNGVTSFRVDGRLHSIRVRRNFKTRDEAIAEKAALDIQAEQHDSDMRPVPTCLAAEQVREAEAAFQRLNGRTRSLSFYLDFALANCRAPRQDVALAEAAQSYTQREICELRISSELARLRALGFAVDVSADAGEFLLRQGFHKTLGARPMRSAVERFIQDAIAERVLDGNVTSGNLSVSPGKDRLVLNRSAA